MDEKESPPAPKALIATPLPIAPKETPPAPAPSSPVASEAPTIRDHAERCSLAPWQIKAVIARLHGSREAGAPEVSEVTRLDADAFDEALAEALHGRI